MRIGFFDSGIGGLTVLREAIKILPDADYVYYADTVHVPYGTKSKDDVRNFILEAAAFIAGEHVDALVIACNTATGIVINDLRNIYDFPIIGMEPAVKPAVERSKGKRVLVTATPLALKEERFHDLVSRVDSEHKVDLLPLPGLVDLAEKFDFEVNNAVTYLKKQLSEFDINEYETVVLGCTHFTYFKRAFKMIFPEGVDIIDGNYGTIKHMKNILDDKKLVCTGNRKVTFFSSGVLETNEARFKNYMEYIDSME